jgi:hypothetical protein
MPSRVAVPFGPESTHSDSISVPRMCSCSASAKVMSGFARCVRDFSGQFLKRYLLIFKTRIFDSRVEAGTPNLAAAPRGPATRPPVSASAASMACFSSSSDRFQSGSLTARPPANPSACGKVAGRNNQLSSTDKLCVSQRMTDRSMTFCNSRMFPGQEYDCSRSMACLWTLRILFPAFLP